MCRSFPSRESALYFKFSGIFYTALKVFDLMDTVFFVLRKKWNQVTPLHVIHHSIMPLTSYVVMKIAFSPGPALTVILNSFVHTIMYYYYHLASQGHHVWWKKYITVVQLIQFYIVVVHGVHTFFFASCSYPRSVALIQTCEGVYFIFSFTMFYLKSYKSKRNTETSQDRQQVDSDKQN